MILYRCTTKVLKELCLPLPQVCEPDTEGFLGSWFVNLFKIQRRKCLMFTNSLSLYSVFIPGVRRSDFDQFDTFFIEHLAINLTSEGFNDFTNMRIKREFYPVIYAKTNNRSILGSMIELTFMAEVIIDECGGLENCDIKSVNLQINRTKLSAIGNRHPIDVFQDLVCSF